MMKGSHQEAEIKLELTKKMYEHLRNQYTSNDNGVNQENFFLDSSDNVLVSNKWVLRIRIENSDKGYITVKGPGEIKGSLHIRPEYESSLPVPEALSLIDGFDLESIDVLPCNELVKRFGNHFVKTFLSFQNLRISFLWKEWNFELDKTTIFENDYYELEVEIDPLEKDILVKELKALFKSCSWDYIPSSMSKFKRALKIQRP